jgi:hypothetical protein
MNIDKSLTKELVKYMLAIFGFSDNCIYNTVGIFKDEFKTDLNIKIQYDDNKIIKHPIFSASTIFNGSKLHVVGISINDEDGVSFAALFKLDDFYTYGIKLTDSDEDTIFLLSKVKNNWTNPSMYEKIIACAGLEKLNDAGMFWKLEPATEFYNILAEIVEM